ncbi:MAG: hypothetical protein IJ757_06465 [Clostridiales bacterium]|nr:hypothetical protein [Clostridiales bacterium]
MIKLNRKLPKFASAIMAFIVVGGAFAPAVTVRANSGPIEWWYGNEGEGPKPEDSDCPLEVTSETLTFDIPDLLPPDIHRWTEDTITGYESHVTAEYTFYNPTDETIAANLVFPFSIFPYTQNLRFATALDDRYSITVNGQTVERTVMTTYLEPGVEFDARNMMPEQVNDEDYLEDDYYHPDMPVVRCLYDHYSLQQDENHYATVYLDPAGKAEDRVYYVPYGLCDYSRVPARDPSKSRDIINVYVGDDQDLELYVIGTDNDIDVRLPLSGELIKPVIRETMTFEELLLSGRPDGLNVSDTTWYNLTLDQINANPRRHEFNEYILYNNFYGESTSLLIPQGTFLRWYCYTLTVEPGQTVVNRVEAPLYPDICDSHAYETKTTYNYEYLLSPASLWADFGELYIRINTPYDLKNFSLRGMREVEGGYEGYFDGLPNSELNFSIVQEDVVGNAFLTIFLLLAAFFGGGWIIVVGIILLIVIIRLCIPKTKSSHH